MDFAVTSFMERTPTMNHRPLIGINTDFRVSPQDEGDLQPHSQRLLRLPADGQCPAGPDHLPLIRESELLPILEQLDGVVLTEATISTLQAGDVTSPVGDVDLRPPGDRRPPALQTRPAGPGPDARHRPGNARVERRFRWRPVRPISPRICPGAFLITIPTAVPIATPWSCSPRPGLDDLHKALHL